MKHNQILGEARTGEKTGVCQRCGRTREHGDLNHEAQIHHTGLPHNYHGKPLECIDRKSCDRATRKKTRKV